MYKPNIKILNFLFVLSLVVASQGGYAASVKELSQLSLEQFSELDVVVTSVSRKPQKLSDTAAAVFVISNEDIKRSGATNIPEALRMVPGIQVARIDANKWAISARGFNGRFTNKLLVLIDGRTVYNPMFSGVYWNRQDVLMEDIDRIEVIRGPGATLWGANAVNGVINVISKKARDTQGWQMTAGAGTEEQGFGSLRYGNKLGENADARGYIKYIERDHGVNNDNTNGVDDWDTVQGGFRLDWQPLQSDSFTLQGDLQDTGVGTDRTTSSLTAPFSTTQANEVDINGWNILGRWKHKFSDVSDMELQLYYDSHEREQTELVSNGTLVQLYETFDMDFQHRFGLGSRQEILWGLGYRNISDKFLGDFTTSLNPIQDTTELFSAFVQDDISFADGKVHLIVGSKFEHNAFTGIEIQPNIRMNWNVTEKYSLWSSISRAVRTPGRSTDIRINQSVTAGTPPRLVSIFGNPDIHSEKVTALELGLRGQPDNNLKYDFAAFYNIYNDLRTFERGTASVLTTPVTHVLIPITSQTFMTAETYGLEMSLEWIATERWKLNLAYSFLEMQLHKESISTAATAESAEGESPEHQISLRSSFDITNNLFFDTWVRYVDELPTQKMNAYITMDTRLAWKPVKGMELSVVGQNLLNDSQLQFMPEILDITSTQAQRSVYLKLQWQF